MKRVVTIFCLGLLCSCAQPVQRQGQPSNRYDAPATDYLDHTIVFSGETLADIAAWYTGNAKNWNEIQGANPGLRPDKLRLGQVIRIPRSLVVNDRPFTKASFRRKVSAVPTPVAAEPGTPAAEPTAVPTVTDSEPMKVETPVVEATPVVPVETAAPTPIPEAPPIPAATPVPAAPQDSDREKLLDELLK